MNRQRFAVFALALVLLGTAARIAAQESKEPKASESEQDSTYAKELEVKELLLEKGGQVALHIRVTVDHAKAILTGDVPTRAAQELAEEVALSVDGIKSVDNRLRIVPPPGGNAADAAARTMEEETADAYLESKVKRHLFSEIGKRARDLEVEAVDGVVSLRGTLPDDSRKKIALDAATNTKGVKRVVDLIKVKP